MFDAINHQHNSGYQRQQQHPDRELLDTIDSEESE